MTRFCEKWKLLCGSVLNIVHAGSTGEGSPTFWRTVVP